jgi:hypothetical protein
VHSGGPQAVLLGKPLCITAQLCCPIHRHAGGCAAFRFTNKRGSNTGHHLATAVSILLQQKVLKAIVPVDVACDTARLHCYAGANNTTHKLAVTADASSKLEGRQGAVHMRVGFKCAEGGEVVPNRLQWGVGFPAQRFLRAWQAVSSLALRRQRRLVWWPWMMASMRRRIEERAFMLKLVATLACSYIPCTGPSQRLPGQGKKDLGKDCCGDGRRRLEIAAGFPEGGGLGG